jgi:hypothetical protein
MLPVSGRTIRESLTGEGCAAASIVVRPEFTTTYGTDYVSGLDPAVTGSIRGGGF